MKFGLDKQAIQILEDIIVNPLKARGIEIWVFGSRARGDHQKFSDLDVLIEGIIPPSVFSSMKESLEESSLPIKVDLVPLNELAESYKTSVFRDRVHWASIV